MDWTELVTVRSKPASGYLDIVAYCKLPDATSDFPCTDNQILAIKIFYQMEFENLTFCQASTLFSCREFARLCARSIFKSCHPVIQDSLSRCIAAFLLSDGSYYGFVNTWNQKNFTRGTGSPRVTGSPIYADVLNFAEYLDGMLFMEGWTREVLKGGSFR